MMTGSFNSGGARVIAVFIEDAEEVVVAEEERLSCPLKELQVKLTPSYAQSIIDFLDDVIFKLGFEDKYGPDGTHFHLALENVERRDRFTDLTIYPIRNNAIRPVEED